MKKLLSICLSVVMLLGILSVPAFATETETTESSSVVISATEATRLELEDYVSYGTLYYTDGTSTAFTLKTQTHANFATGKGMLAYYTNAKTDKYNYIDVDFEINAEQAGYYNIDFNVSPGGTYSSHTRLYINGTNILTASGATTMVTNSNIVEKQYLNEGTNTVKIRINKPGTYGTFQARLDYLEFEPWSSAIDVPASGTTIEMEQFTEGTLTKTDGTTSAITLKSETKSYFENNGTGIVMYYTSAKTDGYNYIEYEFELDVEKAGYYSLNLKASKGSTYQCYTRMYIDGSHVLTTGSGSGLTTQDNILAKQYLNEGIVPIKIRVSKPTTYGTFQAALDYLKIEPYSPVIEIPAEGATIEMENYREGLLTYTDGTSSAITLKDESGKATAYYTNAKTDGYNYIDISMQFDIAVAGYYDIDLNASPGSTYSSFIRLFVNGTSVLQTRKADAATLALESKILEDFYFDAGKATIRLRIYNPEVYGVFQAKIDYLKLTSVFHDFKSKSTDAAALGTEITGISNHLDETAWDIYGKLNNQASVNASLYAALAECETLEAFSAQFTSLVKEAYFEGYDLGINITYDLGGKRGKINVEGETVPTNAYALVEALDESENIVKKFIVNVKEGTGYYNVYETAEGASKINITLCSDKNGTNALSATRTVTLKSLNIPEIFITELNNYSRFHYITSGEFTEVAVNDSFQYIELYNYGETTVDLSEYNFVYNDGTEHTFNWIKETDGSLIVEPGEFYIIGVYSSVTAQNGLAYNSDEALAEFWNAFNAHYAIDVPVTNRVMIACMESGSTENTLDGMKKLTRTVDAGVLCTAELRKNGETITKVSLPGEKVRTTYTYQFIPSEIGSTEETLLFCTGTFPYKLLDEQKFDYCEKAYFGENEKTKVMSYNVCVTNSVAGATVADRVPLMKQAIEEVDPDVFGTNETPNGFINAVKGGLMPDYSFVYGYSQMGKTDNLDEMVVGDSINMIGYKTDKFNLLDSGCDYLTEDGTFGGPIWGGTDQYSTGSNCRTMTWAVLENKETKEVMSFICSHLTLDVELAKVKQLEMLYTKGAKLKETYGGGIAIVGDLNLHEGLYQYIEVVNSGVVVDSKYMTTNHDSICTHTGTMINTDLSSSPYGVAIDFCLVSPEDYLVQSYKIEDGMYGAYSASDHLAVCVELLSKNLVEEHKKEIVTYDADTNSVLAEFDARKEYKIVFADYEGGKLMNTDTVSYTADCDGYAWINQTNVNFTLGESDKVFIWENGNSLNPECREFQIVIQ